MLRPAYIEVKTLSQPNKVVRVGSLRETYHAAKLRLSNITCSIGPPSTYGGPLISRYKRHWDVPFFIRTPPKDSQFLHKGGRIFQSKELPNNELFGNFFQRCRQKMNPSDFFLQRVPPELWGVGILPSLGGVRIKNGTTHCLMHLSMLSPREGDLRHMWGIWLPLLSPPLGIWLRVWAPGWGRLTVLERWTGP